ncbi:MAG: hypothetical protein EOM62_20955, partial [Bacteroidia bacterium]|nr:hypothetical protein [Bacteroidia bacterium]
MKLFRFDHIAIFCNDTSTTVVPMVKYYYDKPEFNGWCFNVNERYMEGEIEASTEFRNAKRRVFYDFEHFNRSNDDYCRWFIGIMSDRRYDEWWDYN